MELQEFIPKEEITHVDRDGNPVAENFETVIATSKKQELVGGEWTLVEPVRYVHEKLPEVK